MGSPSSRSIWKGDFSHSAGGDSKPQGVVPDHEIKATYLVTIYLAWMFWALHHDSI
jgi:hypothetical protein